MWDIMLKELGPGLVAPAVAVAIVGWLAKLLPDMHTGSRQSRREFLELWQTIDKGDDLALETVTRHLFGDYLPAAVIRAAIALPFSSQQLQRLCTVWAHVRYDAATGELVLAHPAYRTPQRRRLEQIGYTLGYLVLAFAGTYLLLLASRLSPAMILPWMLVVSAAGALVVAFGSLARGDTVKSLGAGGIALVDALNARMRAGGATELGSTPQTPARSVPAFDSADS